MANWVRDIMQTERPIVIAVMGMTGSGKSTFIKNLTEDANIKVGRGMRSCTKDIQPAGMKLDGHTIYLVDTTGFDDTDLSDTDVLTQIATWLLMTSRESLKLSGLIYLHRITDDRLGGTATRNLMMLQNLCGSDNMGNVVLVTSRWEKIDYEEGVEREKELTGTGGFWEGMIDNGAKTHRYDGTKDNARDIVRAIMHKAPIYLQLQEEMKMGKTLADTAAGQAIITELELRARRREQELQRMEETMKLAASEAENKNAALLEEHKREMQALLERTARERSEMENLRKSDMEGLKEMIAELERKLQAKRSCVVM